MENKPQKGLAVVFVFVIEKTVYEIICLHHRDNREMREVWREQRRQRGKGFDGWSGGEWWMGGTRGPAEGALVGAEND